MALGYKFVSDIGELADSTQEFYGTPEFWKDAVGTVPKYFIHVKVGTIHAFALSKFAAFKSISVDEYIRTHRHKTEGGTTQKHIATITRQKWIPRSKVQPEVRIAFDKWMGDFFPNYDLSNASFISLNKSGAPVKRKKRKKFISPEDLIKRLNHQMRIGAVGEAIAMKYEIGRLKEKGVRNPDEAVDQVSKRNSAAGYDIYSFAKKEKRYIEVKSSLNTKLNFYITENEVKTLEPFGKEAWIYLIHITDLRKKQGVVLKIVSDPIKRLKKAKTLVAVAYKAYFK